MNDDRTLTISGTREPSSRKGAAGQPDDIPGEGRPNRDNAEHGRMIDLAG
jgi:hypothetical protein